MFKTLNLNHRSETSINSSITSTQDPTDFPKDMASASLARAPSCRRNSNTVFSRDHLTWESAFFCVKPRLFSNKSNYHHYKKRNFQIMTFPFLFSHKLKLLVREIVLTFKCWRNLSYVIQTSFSNSIQKIFGCNTSQCYTWKSVQCLIIYEQKVKMC